jgi:hypothetical protein
MLIKNYPVISKDKKRELVVDIEIEDIQWENDSIGWYEYWGHMEYDYRPDHVSEFVIESIYYNDKIIHHKKILEFLTNILYEDNNFRERIEKVLKNKEEIDENESIIENREYYLRGVQ